MDFADINRWLEQILPDPAIRFEELLECIFCGEWKKIGDVAIQYLLGEIDIGFQQNKKVFTSTFLLLLILSILLNFADGFHDQQAARIGFFIVYMLLATVCLREFQIVFWKVEDRLCMLTDFMRIFCPEYFLLVTLSSGGKGLYETILLSIYLVELIVLKFIFPLIRMDVIVQVMNHLTGGHRLSELESLLRTVICWVLKGMVGTILGFQTIQSLLSPAMGGLKRGVLKKTMEALPGIGNVFESVADVAFAASVVIKNGIGICGALLLLWISMTPILQLLIPYFYLRVLAAVLQPISNKRVIYCIKGISQGYELLFRVLCNVMMLFLITFVILSATTRG